jgi:RNA polymerase sigma-70 factor (ECF subfamily)
MPMSADHGYYGLYALRRAVLVAMAPLESRDNLLVTGMVGGDPAIAWAASSAGDISSPSGPQPAGGRDIGTSPHAGNARVSPGHRAGLDSRIVELVDLAKGGDSDAFGQLYEHYVGQVYRYLYYRVGSVTLAEDLTSEAFFRALRSLDSFNWQGKDFGAWLTTIARNLAMDHYKSGLHRLEVTTDEITNHDSATDGPEDDVITRSTNEILLKSLRKLSPEQQDCLVLRFLQGLSIAQTAQALNRSEGAIKQLQLRATRSLASMLPEDLR